MARAAHSSGTRRFSATVRKVGINPCVEVPVRVSRFFAGRFGGCVTYRHWLDVGLWLSRRVSHSALRRVEQPIPGCYVHTFRLRSPNDIDAALTTLVREAYGVGQRSHLRRAE